MGYGIIEPRHSGHVPGTVRLFEDNSSSVVAIPVGSRRLKRGKGKQSDIVLVPQPSDSPNDPLVRKPFTETGAHTGELRVIDAYLILSRTGLYGSEI